MILASAAVSFMSESGGEHEPNTPGVMPVAVHRNGHDLASGNPAWLQIQARLNIRHRIFSPI
jgi:hypothetical protein